MPELGQWNPKVVELTREHGRLLTKAASNLDATNLGLSATELGDLRPVLQKERKTWESFVENESADTIVGWIKSLTLLERDVSGFEFGDRSPVITLYRILNQREQLPADLLAWIKNHTTNRFLPFGSVFDRL